MWHVILQTYKSYIIIVTSYWIHIYIYIYMSSRLQYCLEMNITVDTRYLTVHFMWYCPQHASNKCSAWVRQWIHRGHKYLALTGELWCIFFSTLETRMQGTCIKSTLYYFIAQVYRLSAVHCQMTRYSQRVPGYLTRYSVSANEISFDKKISQWDCVFQIRLGLQENDSPLHLVTSSGFLKA